MHGLGPIDPGRTIDWGRTSADYARHRPGYPPSFHARLSALEIGRAGQRILDLGTGTGNLAREFARRGAVVTGVDVSTGQIEAARELADGEALAVDFRVAAAEETGLPSGAFDVVSASQCWLYFDESRIVPEVARLLAPGGVLVTCHICWLPKLDPLAAATEELVLAFNPAWSAAGYEGVIPPVPRWAEGRFDLVAMFWYDEAIPFTAESWRGRIRACRGIGAALAPAEVEAFDSALAELLAGQTGEGFEILHRIDAHVLAPRRG